MWLVWLGCRAKQEVRDLEALYNKGLAGRLSGCAAKGADAEQAAAAKCAGDCKIPVPS